MFSRPSGSKWEVRKLAEVAEFFGANLNAVKQWATMPAWPGTPEHYALDKIARWLRNEGPDRPANRRARGDLSPEVTESPATERWRAARARREERKDAEEAKQVIRVDVFRTSVTAAMAEIRSFAERQIRQTGERAADDWACTISKVEQAIRHAVSLPDDRSEANDLDRESSQAAAANPAKRVGRKKRKTAKSRAPRKSAVPTRKTSR